MKFRSIIAVIGSGRSKENDTDYRIAFQTGKLLVDNGFRVLTGGLGGIMEGAMEGARTSNSYREGDTIAILPGLDHDAANPYADIIIPTGLGIARNMIVTNSHGVIAIGGGSGTLSEMAFSWQKGRPLVSLRVLGWSGELADRKIDSKGSFDMIPGARSPEEAVGLLKEMLRDSNINHDTYAGSVKE